MRPRPSSLQAPLVPDPARLGCHAHRLESCVQSWPPPPAQVPYWQSRIVQGCRKRGKPVIVATNMLESMIDNPTPTRAEVRPLGTAAQAPPRCLRAPHSCAPPACPAVRTCAGAVGGRRRSRGCQGSAYTQQDCLMWLMAPSTGALCRARPLPPACI